MTVSFDTKYLGLDLKNPLVAAACPLTGKLDTLKRLEDAGIAAVTLPSLFEEQLEHDEMELHTMHHFGSGAVYEASEGYFPELDTYNTGPDDYLDLIRNAKKSLEIPVVASLNGTTSGGWVHYAALAERAGADAVELNIYHIPTDPNVSAVEVEKNYVELVQMVRDTIKIPLAVKVPPFFSAPANMAKQLVTAGADGLVLFNRFVQPDIDLDSLQVLPKLKLSTSEELRLPLRWTAILKGRIDCSLAVTSGVHGSRDVLKVLLAGADVATMASALLAHGPQHVTNVLAEMEAWLGDRDYTSVQQMRGSMSQQNCSDPENFERVGYMATLASYSAPEW